MKINLGTIGDCIYSAVYMKLLGYSGGSCHMADVNTFGQRAPIHGCPIFCVTEAWGGTVVGLALTELYCPITMVTVMSGCGMTRSSVACCSRYTVPALSQNGRQGLLMTEAFLPPL